MCKIPEFLDIWKINPTTLGVVLEVDDDYVKLLCKDKITNKVYYHTEMLIDTEDKIGKFTIFNKNYEFVSKSKLIDMLFESK